MKRLILTALASLSIASAAVAETTITREVAIPKVLSSPAEIENYTQALEAAVKRVCRDAEGPNFGITRYRYVECVKTTRAQVAANDPTGLYAASLGLSTRTEVAQN